MNFPPEYRLHYSWEYRRFFHQSEVIKLSECLVLRIRNDRAHARLGISVKSRTNSVGRNRVKRRIREAFREVVGTLGNYDYHVVIPKTKRITLLYARRVHLCLLKELPQAIAKSGSRA